MSESNRSEIDDQLLKGFSDVEKEFIVKNVYPILNKTLVRFVDDAKKYGQIPAKNSSSAAIEVDKKKT